MRAGVNVGRYRCLWGMVVCAAVLSWHGRVAAQELRGVVVDIESATPVKLAYVGLLAPGREFVAATLAGADGRFSVSAPGPGTYFLYVARNGYRTLLDGLFELGEEGVLELSVGLTPAPVAVEPIVVEVERRGIALEDAGFYERRASGLGHFITREEIERAATEDLTDVMRGVADVRVFAAGVSPVVPTGVQNPEIFVRRGGEWCSPALYIDGVLVARGGQRAAALGVRPDDYVDPSEVDGVEIYTRISETPPQFDAAGGCGVVLIWTRRR